MKHHVSGVSFFKVDSHMTEQVRTILVSIVSEHGQQLVNEHKKCVALLKDFCPDNMERSVLIQTLNAKIPSGLLDSLNGLPVQDRIVHSIRKLTTNTRIAEPNARWAVESWAIALKLILPFNNPTY